MKKLFAIAVLALSALTVASAKTYTIVLAHSTKAGTVQLKAGQYKLKVDGANAVFTDAKSQSFTTPVKVQSTEKKFEQTRVQTTTQGADEVLTEIDLGGSTTKLGF